MEGFKTYRHAKNPKEKEFHDKFIKYHFDKDISMIIFPPDRSGYLPNEFLSEREKKIVITTIQWLGSSIGQAFLEECGFTEIKDNEK